LIATRATNDAATARLKSIDLIFKIKSIDFKRVDLADENTKETCHNHAYTETEEHLMCPR